MTDLLDFAVVPKFTVGDSGIIGGMEWRVVRGRKAPGDMAVELRSPEWNRVKMAVALLLADFHYQVEEILFPRENANRGGEYPLAAISQACRTLGWETVAARVEAERNGQRYPEKYIHREVAPYHGREDDGRKVGQIRSSVGAVLWATNGLGSREMLAELRKVIGAYA